MNFKQISLIACCVMLLAGCFVAPKTTGPTISQSALKQEQQFQHELVLEEKIHQQIRLFRVGAAVLDAAVDLCDKTIRRTGMMYLAQAHLKPEFHAMANRMWGLADFPKVLAITQGSAADMAGMRELDTIIGVNGVEHRSGKALEQAMLEIDPQAPTVQFMTLRNGEKHLHDLKRAKTCGYPVQLADNPAINAFADGSRIVINTGMMDFATKDEELALVIAHELAHNTEQHVQAKQKNVMGGQLMGAVVDALLRSGTTFSRAGGNIAAQSYSADFEREADYVGMYMLARTGYEIKDAGKFWRRMAVRSKGAGIDFTTTHPTTAERMLAITKVEQEIQQKRRNNQPLLPEGR